MSEADCQPMGRSVMAKDSVCTWLVGLAEWWTQLWYVGQNRLHCWAQLKSLCAAQNQLFHEGVC